MRSPATGASVSIAANSPSPNDGANDCSTGMAKGMAASTTAGTCTRASFADRTAAVLAIEAVFTSIPS